MAIITATHIERTFGTGPQSVRVLKGIDLSIDQGEFVAIMGKSGAGKSTLMYQLSALDRPTAGSIIIDDIDITTLSERQSTSFRLLTLGYVFQDYALVPDLSARENVMMPLLMRGYTWNAATTTAETSLVSVGLEGKGKNLPSELSGGEQQRVAVARAIAGEPKILFADEPTANLDSISGRQIITLLEDLHARGQTIVMVTHEEEYTTGVDRIVRLEDGQIVSDTQKEPIRQNA